MTIPSTVSSSGCLQDDDDDDDDSRHDGFGDFGSESGARRVLRSTNSALAVISSLSHHCTWCWLLLGVLTWVGFWYMLSFCPCASDTHEDDNFYSVKFNDIDQHGDLLSKDLLESPCQVCSNTCSNTSDHAHALFLPD